MKAVTNVLQKGWYVRSYNRAQGQNNSLRWKANPIGVREA